VLQREYNQRFVEVVAVSAEYMRLDQPCRECGRIEAKNKEGGLAANAPVLDPERVGK
jgi:hypothetical protein